MPTYQYSCTECGHFLEAVQKFTDDALTVCPECGGRLRKVFKGSGFYRTDSRKAPSSSSDDTNGSSGSGASKEPAAAGSSSSSSSAGSAVSSSSSSSD